MCKSDGAKLISMVFNMTIKFEKYWKSTIMMNMIMYVGFVLDPQCKIKSIAFWLKKYKGIECGNRIEVKVRLRLNRWIEQYHKFHGLGHE